MSRLFSRNQSKIYEENEEYYEFCKQIKKSKRRKEINPTRTCRPVGSIPKTISRYELGLSKPRYRKTYDLLAEALDTSHDYLVTDEEDFILTTRERYGISAGKEAEELVDGVIGLMAGGEIPETDKRAILDAISEAYYIARQDSKKLRKTK